MIDRYCRPEMQEVWSDARRLARWLDVELAVTATREDRGEVARGTSERIRASRASTPRACWRSRPRSTTT
jgi:adenylosuccinate lyase